MGGRLRPFFSEQGDGEAVVCLHANASTGAQWRGLAERLGPGWRVIAVDGLGAGRSPDWPAGAAATLDAEVDFLCPAFDAAGERFHLVGHSYGGATALVAAARWPSRVRSLVLYEPVLFSLVADDDPKASPAAGIWRAAGDAAAAIERGDGEAAARRFIDFWTGDGAWSATPEARRPALIEAMRHVGRWRDAAFGPAPSAAALAALAVPTLLLAGDRSPESSLAVVRRLATTLRGVTAETLPGLGHMGPVTHAPMVQARIAASLRPMKCSSARRA